MFNKQTVLIEMHLLCAYVDVVVSHLYTVHQDTQIISFECLDSSKQ